MISIFMGLPVVDDEESGWLKREAIEKERKSRFVSFLIEALKDKAKRHDKGQLAEDLSDG